MFLAKKTEERFTYQDYITWHDDERWELIDGIAYNMSPAPSLEHQEIAGNCYNILKNALKGKACKPFIAPIDVVFSKSDVVQPDILVVCNKNKLTKANVQGAPDLVIEILSPSTKLKDKREKRLLYERYGVKEYIIIDITDKYVECFFLGENGKYSASDIYTSEETIKLFSLNNMKVALPEIFEVTK